ncbi:MAG: glutamate ligase domain-containing protein, partial [Thermoguttaceae bacterium]
GRGPAMVVEACEYRENFLSFHPQQAVLLGIEPDHFDCYPRLDQLEHAFALFIRGVRPDGFLAVRHECPRSRRAAAAASCRVETFGLPCEAHWQAANVTSRGGCCSFTVRSGGKDLCRIELKVLGHHQVLNALAAAATAITHGAPAERVATEISLWPGLRRRLEVVDRCRDVTWVDDYAHHPTELAAGLAAIRERFPKRRVFCLYQPHQASRMTRLLDETAASLQNADCVLITDIFRAREPSPVPGEASTADLAARTRSLGVEVPPIHSAAQCTDFLLDRVVPGDVVATVGAGNIRETGHEFIRRLREGRSAG